MTLLGVYSVEMSILSRCLQVTSILHIFKPLQKLENDISQTCSTADYFSMSSDEVA